MPSRVLTALPSHSGAFGLVAACSSFGVVACTAGALGWGLLGLLAGMVGAWLWFLLGLVLLYRREQCAASASGLSSARSAMETEWAPSTAGL